jgi:EmrB/QacA subfamily drug resistance transporter
MVVALVSEDRAGAIVSTRSPFLCRLDATFSRKEVQRQSNVESCPARQVVGEKCRNRVRWTPGLRELPRRRAVSDTGSKSTGWLALVALATAQFVMVLDQSVMNVSISALVKDFDTTVSTIQAVITLYCLVMAMLIMTGAKIGDIIGRRRAFVIGLIIYACGSALTAASQTVFTLALGWSILEGIGAGLVLPALAALIAGNFEGPRRKVAYAIIGGVAGAGIAIGPILGGWATTNVTWRIVFVGEVVLVAFILIMTPKVKDAVRPDPVPKLDYVGSVLSASGLGLFVFGVLESSTWGWLKPKNSPITIFGFSLTIFVMAAGLALIWAFVTWQRHREETNRDPLVHLSLARVSSVRAGLIGLFSQNLILMGVFFVIPLYLQLVLGLDALQTGIKMLPISITMFLTAAAGSRLSNRFPVRSIVRAGLVVTIAGCLILLTTIQPTLSNAGFALGMAVLGIGMGLMVSQLGNVVQSSVEDSGRSEAGGLQYTGQQLGSSLGVALIGAIVLMGLTSTFISNVEKDSRISSEVAAQVGVAAGNNTNFVSSDEVHAAATEAGLDSASATAIVEDYEAAQLRSLKAGLLAASLLALLSLALTRELPHERVVRRRKETSTEVQERRRSAAGDSS